MKKACRRENGNEFLLKMDFLEPKALKKNEKLNYLETGFSKISFEGHGL